MHGKAPVILIVDDVKTNLLVLRNILGKEGFEVIESSDGMMAREIAAV
jgi:CheY-like chemotaxis protein